jgi:transposase
MKERKEEQEEKEKRKGKEKKGKKCDANSDVFKSNTQWYRKQISNLLYFFIF